MKLTFQKVKDFFISWGMFPSAEDCNEGLSNDDWLNEEVIAQGIKGCSSLEWGKK